MSARKTCTTTATVMGFVLLAATAQAAQISNARLSMPEDDEITFGQAGQPSAIDRTITVRLKDTAYDLANLTVKNGETIKFIIINEDDIEHEFTLGTREMQAADRAKMEQQFEDDASMEMTEANSVSVDGLQTKELIWTFQGPSELEFACNIPGHYEYGMKGALTVLNTPLSPPMNITAARKN